jgi:hypothetical protein
MHAKVFIKRSTAYGRLHWLPVKVFHHQEAGAERARGQKGGATTTARKLNKFLKNQY